MADAAAALGPLTRAVYERVEALAPTLAGFHFLGDVLDDQTTLAWIDFVHVTPDANRRIADRMIGLLPVN
jgi:hypothetical protein